MEKPMKKYILPVFILILCRNLIAQTEEPIPCPLPTQQIHSLYQQIPQLRKLQKNDKQTGPGLNDLIVGAVDPDEVVTITGDYYLYGDVYIYNNGILNLDGANFQMDGDIFIMGHGHLNVQGGIFTIIQEYIYEHNAILAENGSITFSGMEFHSSNQSWSIGMTDSSQYTLENTEIADGFITTGLMAASNATITNTDTAGEFLCFGDNSIDFRDCDFILMWMVLPDSSVVDVALPTDSPLNDFTFSEDEPGIENIPYSVTIGNCTNVNWGLISITGSDAVFRDSDFRAVGLLFNDPDSIVVRNLSNDSHHADDVVDVPDRNLRLINSHVQTWNLYASTVSNITVSNCVFGEMLTQDSSRAFITNSVCDGTGGYLGAFNQSFMLIAGSLIKSQVISRHSAVLVSAVSGLLGSEIDADESSIMFLANSTRFVEPEAHTSAVILEGFLPIIEGSVESLIPIPGTARILSGPENPLPLMGYSVKYAQASGIPVWYATDGFHANPVINDTLAWWNTTGLQPGDYAMQLTLYLSAEDSISTESYARLDLQSFIYGNESATPSIYTLEQNYPNPFNAETNIRFSLPRRTRVTIRVFDILGKERALITDSFYEAGIHNVPFNASDLASGIYIYSIHADTFIQHRKMAVIQ